MYLDSGKNAEMFAVAKLTSTMMRTPLASSTVSIGTIA